MKAHPCKYIVKEDFDYNPSYGDTTDEERTTHFKKGEVYEFEPYLGKCHKDGEMSLVTHILPEMNNNFVWNAEFFNEHFVKQLPTMHLTKEGTVTSQVVSSKKNVLDNSIIIRRDFTGKKLSPEEFHEFQNIVNERRPYCSSDFKEQHFTPDKFN